MYRLKILSVGKTKESWLEDALQEYLSRLQSILAIEFIWVKTDKQLVLLASKEPTLICLDPQGQLFDSRQFSKFLLKKFDEGGSRLAILIGGAEGLPAEINARFPQVSLSRMTFTHQLTRLILLEQIYRAFEIEKGTHYHK